MILGNLVRGKSASWWPRSPESISRGQAGCQAEPQASARPSIFDPALWTGKVSADRRKDIVTVTIKVDALEDIAGPAIRLKPNPGGDGTFVVARHSFHCDPLGKVAAQNGRSKVFDVRGIAFGEACCADLQVQQHRLSGSLADDTANVLARPAYDD